MEVTLSPWFNHARAASAVVILAGLAGCAEQAVSRPPAPPEPVATMAPDLVGAWYQVVFNSNSIDIDARGALIVSSAAKAAADNPSSRVSVVGRSDRVGRAVANLTLSERRAERVRDALIAAGVAPGRIDTRWTGEIRQRVGTRDNISEERNRVVDITVLN